MKIFRMRKAIAAVLACLFALMLLCPAIPVAGAENSGAGSFGSAGAGTVSCASAGMETMGTVLSDRAAVSAGGGDRKTVFVGDSRTVGMYITLSGAAYSDDINAALGNEVYIGRVAMGFDWFAGTGMQEAASWLAQGNTDLVILMGCNDMGSPVSSANRYAEYVNANADSWSENGNRVFFDSVNPVGHRNGGAETSSSIYSNDGTCAPFNDTLKNALSDKVTWIDSYSFLLSGGYATVDGIHYDSGTCQAVHDYIVGAVSEASKKEYTAVLDAAGGTCSLNEKQIREGDSLADLPVPERQGYVFGGWYLDDSKVTEKTVMPAGNITLTASWKPSDHTPYQVIFHCGNEADDVETRYGTTGEMLKVSPPARDGYRTPGAQTHVISADGTTKFEFTYTPASNRLTIHAGKGVRLSGAAVPDGWKSGDRERSFAIRCRYGEEVPLQAESEEGYGNLKTAGDFAEASSETAGAAPDGKSGAASDKASEAGSAGVSDLKSGTASGGTSDAESNGVSGGRSGSDFYMPDHDARITFSASPVVYRIRYAAGIYRIDGLPETYTVEDLPLHLKNPDMPSLTSFGFWTDENGTKIRTVTEKELGDLQLIGVTYDYRAAAAADLAGILLLVILGVIYKKRKRKR